MMHFDKPREGEYAPYAIQYIGLVPDDGEIVTYLEEYLGSAVAFFRLVPEEKLTYRYAEGKWTVKEVLGHIIDTERIYAYRALRFARKDATELPGFEQDDYVKTAGANARTIDDLLDELTAVRASTIAFVKSLDNEAVLRSGVSNGRRMSVRAAIYIIAGHQAAHINVIKERYL